MRCHLLTLVLVFASAAWDAAAQVESSCYTNFTEIGEIEDLADVQKIRTYVLCPNTTFEIGFIGSDGGFIGDETPLGLRANMKVLCGEDGSIENNCILDGGSLGLAAFPSLFAFEYLHNVFISGLTFNGQSLYGSLLRLPGEITFFDCEFNNMGNLAPAFARWYPEDFFEPTRTGHGGQSFDPNSWKRRLQRVSPVYREPNATDVLQVSYINCRFSENFAIELPEGQGVPGVVVTQGQTRTTIRNCVFQNNTYPALGRYPVGFTILQDEGEISVEDSCFVGNLAQGPAPIVVLRGTATATSSNEISPVPENPCEFIAIYDNLDQGLDVPPSECIQAGSDEACAALSLVEASLLTATPSVSSMPSPASSLSYTPSVKPSVSPTVAQTTSKAPSAEPTINTVTATPAPGPSTLAPALGATPEPTTTSGTKLVSRSLVKFQLALAAAVINLV